ncbi:MAG: tetratricopeptide repeat protein [Thermodesulfobacteriota bacterium]
MNNPSPSIDRRVLAAGAVLAALITLVVFLPSFNNGFVNWDDNVYVYANRGIRQFDLKWLFTASVSSNWHPLTLLSLTIDYSLWGLKPLGYHAENVVFHAVNTALVFLLASKLFERAGLGGRAAVAASMAASLLFGTHPLHVESVSWISERKDVLSGFFFFLTLLAYMRYASGERKKPIYYAAALLLFLLALMSKPMVVTLPAVLLIIDLYPLGRLKGAGLKKAVIEKIPFFALALFSAVVTILFQRGKAMAALGLVPMDERVITAVRAVAFYLYKAVVPTGLAPLYKLPAHQSITDPWFIVSLAAVLVITVFCFAVARRSRAYLAAWLYYLVTLSPVLGIIQVGRQAAADRYTYLPLLGLFMLAGAGAGLLCERLSRGAGRFGLRAALVIIFAVFSLLTVRQEAFWKDGQALWTREIRVFPREQTAYYSRAEFYKNNGRYAEAIEDLTHAIGLKPDYAEAYSMRGNSYKRLGDLASALRDMKTAVELRPGRANFHYNMSLIYSELGLRDRAAESARRAASLGSAIAADYLGYLESGGR